MDCITAKEYIDLYVDNMLGEDETRQLLLHIKSCGACKKDFDDTLLLKEDLSNLEQLDPPAGLGLSVIKKARRKKAPIFAFASIGIAAAAALIFVLASGIIPEAGMNKNASEQMALSEPRNGADSDEPAAVPKEMTEMQDQIAGTFEDTAMEEGAAEEAAELAPQMAPEMEQESTESDDSFDGGEQPAADSASRSVCEFTFSGKDARDFGRVFDLFIEEYDIDAEYTKLDSGETVMFELKQEAFDAFEEIISSSSLLYVGELYPGCYIKITFLD